MAYGSELRAEKGQWLWWCCCGGQEGATLRGCRGRMEVYLPECPDRLISWFLSQVENVGPCWFTQSLRNPNLLFVLDSLLNCHRKQRSGCSLLLWHQLMSPDVSPCLPALLSLRPRLWGLWCLGEWAELPVAGQGRPWDRS